MTDWRQTTTADLLQQGVIEIGDGYRAKNSEFVDRGGLPFVRVGDVGTTLRLDGLDELPRERAGQYGPKVSLAGDSLITMKGTVGRVAYVSADHRTFVYSPQISYWRSRDSEQVHPRWLRYWLESPEFLGQALAAKGATDMADYINLRDQRRMRITLPPSPAQSRIAAVLASLDDLIQSDRRRIGLLEQMAQAVYREWFVHFRYPGHEAVPLVDSPLGAIPEGWQVAELGLLADVNRRTRKPAEGETLRYLDIAALGDRSISLPAPIRGEDAPGRARRVVRPGDIAWSMVRPGRRAHALLVDPGEDWIASTGVAVLTPHRLSSTLLFEMVSAREFSDYLVSCEGGAAYPAVKPTTFESALVPAAPSQLDQHFADIVAPMHQCIWSLGRSRETLGGLRDLLLPELVTGKIDVSTLDLEALVESVA